MTSVGRAGERGGFPNRSASSIPAVTAEQMREVDRLAVEEFGLVLIQMMENAGIRLAELAMRRVRARAVAGRHPRSVRPGDGDPHPCSAEGRSRQRIRSRG